MRNQPCIGHSGFFVPKKEDKPIVHPVTQREQWMCPRCVASTNRLRAANGLIAWKPGSPQ